MGHKGGQWLVHEECIVHTTMCQKYKVMSNSKKFKPIALAIIELRLSEGIRQLVSYLVS